MCEEHDATLCTQSMHRKRVPASFRNPVSTPSWGSFLTHAEVAKRFEEFDRDGDGFITIAECKAAMNSLERELSDGQIRETMWAWDHDKDGVVDYFEFMDYFLSADKGEDPHGAEKNFQSVDDLLQHCIVKDDKSIAPKLSRGAKVELIKSFKLLDLDKDGFLSREELGLGLKSMNPDFSTQEIEATITSFFDVADKNMDGLIDLYEFSTRAVQKGMYS